VPGVLAAATGSDWSSGGALLTFYFPIVLFAVVAASLYLEFSRQHAIPGRKPLPAAGTAATQGKDAAVPSPPPGADGTVPGERRAAAADQDHEAPGAGA
jgi:hypothetical protein